MRLLSFAYLSFATALAAAFLLTPEAAPVVAEATLDRLDALIDRVDVLAEPVPEPPPAKPDRLDPSERYVVDTFGSPSIGPRDAPVTLVEFVDFQCPYCVRAQNTLKQVREKYGDQVRIVFKHNPLPFHKRAEAAAVAAECARTQGVGDELFWKMSERLWASSRNLERDDLVGHALALELDRGSFERCLDGEQVKKHIDDDKTQAAAVLARGTPTFFINGRPLVGAQPFVKFEELIDSEL